MKKFFIIFILIVLIPILVFALNAKPSEIITVPTAEILNSGLANVSLYNSFAVKFLEDRVGYDYNLAFSYGLFDMMDVTLHMYTYKDYALQFQVLLLKESSRTPSISVGMKNITYNRFIDEGGGGSTVNSGLTDYSYQNRSSDVFSAYVVATENLGKFGKYTVGIGRGEFIGYGRGRYLSTVPLFTDTYLSGSIANEFMFGFFGGIEFPVYKGLSIKADVDGRDVNAGMNYKYGDFSFNAAMTHLELFTAGDPNLRPRLEIGMNCFFDFKSLKINKKSNPGFIVVNILDSEIDEPVDGVIEFMDSSLPPVFVEDGNKKIELPAGKYKIKAMSDECKSMVRDIEIKSNQTDVVFFDMESIENCGILTGRAVDRTTEESVFPKIEIEGIESSLISTDESTGIYQVELMPGTYMMKATLEGYADWVYLVTVEEAKTTIMNIYMLKKGGRVSLKNVNFKSGSADLTKESFSILDDAVIVLTANSQVKIEIQGFTDDKGKADANLSLSKERAESVKDYLVMKGIDESRILTKGFGETMNIADNETEEHRAKNRRIEFIILEQ